jgi:chromosome partitioning protein
LRTIAIINQKGGCGKTTVSINLAAMLATMGRRTLLVDMDPQAHCSLGLAVPEQQVERSICDMLKAGLDGTVSFQDIIWQISRTLDLAPSTMALAGIQHELSNAPDKDRRLVQVLSTVADTYEFCVIDCPPSIGVLTFNALRAADEVLIPVETGYFAMQGAIRQEATIEMLARRAGHHARFRVLATLYDVRIKLSREILSELSRSFGEKLLPMVIHFNSKLKEAASFGQPITEYDPGSRGMQDFEDLANWLIANPPLPLATSSGHGADSAGKPANPAMTRAAELVERAKALSARTAALSSRLAADPDVAAVTRNSSATTLVEEEYPLSDAGIDKKFARVYGVRNTSQGLLFVQPTTRARQMAIAGDFNNWDPVSTPMKRDELLGVWQACIPVPPGQYKYRLVIDGEWVHDPYNPRVETNPFGELNSIVQIVGNETGAAAHSEARG